MNTSTTDKGGKSDNAYRIMVVDDSAVIRGLLTRILEGDPQVSVVESVSNGEIAVKRLESQKIDVVVLDIEMPVMDGLTALPKLLQVKPDVQVIMASTLTRKNAEISLKAMRLGAADYIPKPTSSGELTKASDFKHELVAKVKALGQVARASQKAPLPSAAKTQQGAATTPSAQKPKEAGAGPSSLYPSKTITLRKDAITKPDILAIGSSTGGPQALFDVLGNLGTITQPVVITQHMPATFTALLAEHIARVSSMPSKEGEEGEILKGGHIYLAPGGYHMVFEKQGVNTVIRLNQEPPENFCRPAVDPMLRSLSKIYGSRLLVLILTGMGSDGLRGSEVVTAAGGSVIAQDEQTSVVWGMPGAVATAGLCSAVLPIKEMASNVRQLVMRSAA
ncbi:protein-glutamate methylesterase/protein-glutamine glutaminase [Kiloniella majae]|uniref:protein-glutamate methylesterase/protein-glutamine glutaminase n=1 Tax=Kiloniella majae TaxID=1938558 RepID=UPI000A276F24|nr:chemotaxis response regulator protein-glutamate methylesterase [Kiloniella majae]